MAEALGPTGPRGPGGPGGPADTHAGHDPEVVASLLDGDLVGADRAAAARQVAGCSACAALHRDLLVLASATRELPTPARTFDFRLTAADAERLREPLAASARLTDEMQTTSSHASHDTILVASLADHSLPAPERDAAEALVAACGLCAVLHADLVAISAATRAMPVPTRPRDYTLTRDDAARLRPTGWRRWVAAFGTSRDVFSRPLAVGLTTLGLAGLLVATGPSVLQGLPTVGFGAASSARNPVGAPANGTDPEVGTDTQRLGAAAAASAPAMAAPSEGGVVPDKAPAASVVLGQGTKDIFGSALSGLSSLAPVAGAAATSSTANGSDDGSSGTNDLTSNAEGTVAGERNGPSTMLVVSGVFLFVGLGLFAIRWSARRFGDD